METLLAADWGLFTFINSTLSHPWMDRFFPLITDLHKTLAFQIIFPLLVLVALLRFHRLKGFAIMFGLVLALGFNDWIGGQVLKKHFDRSRPFATEGVEAVKRCPAGGYSFPSNHASNTFTGATYLAFFLPGWAPWVFSIAALVAYSRVYCGVHFPVDVLTGMALGILWGFLFSRGMKALVYRRERMPS